MSVEGEMGMRSERLGCTFAWRDEVCLERWEICSDGCVCMDREMQFGSLWVCL